LLPKVVQAYRRILAQLRERGIEWVQIDEPVLCLDMDAEWLDASIAPMRSGRRASKVLLATYFDMRHAAALPVHGFHIDLVRAPERLETWLQVLPATRCCRQV
jgi:5-methyltetrahydropteroyltriglutamate--homocysteine methyltransferase